MSTAAKITTAEQLPKNRGLGRCELIGGELVMMSPAGFEHGRIVMRISRPLANHVEHNNLGVVLGAETGFLIARNPDTVPAPDVAFLRAARVPATPLRGYFEGAPDLAVEVASPGDTYAEVHGKAADWIAFGCRLVWVVEPKARRVTTYRRDGSGQVLGADATLTGEDVLPGFSIRVGEVFPS